jgi:hypothetical protein
MKHTKPIVILFALLLAAMAFVPFVSAGTAGTDLAEKWQADHTIPVTKTVSTQYSNGTLVTETTYSGAELTKRFGIPEFVSRQELKVSPEDAENLKLTFGKTAVTRSKAQEVFTAPGDPPALLSGTRPGFMNIPVGSTTSSASRST